MKIKSAKAFRYWYKTKHLGIDKNDRTHNENFVGTYHKENGDIKFKGFFNMYHGDKPDIASYLPSILKIAEDGQAIYEFLQNAADCGSTHFYIFYNENYFLAINNGSPFEIEGLQSILNIAQTTKKDPDKIGRFGIGFKLAHRLVGKNEGTDELVKQYKGPILFSWAKLNDLESLLNNESIEPLVPNKENYQEFINSPYLLKLLLTNFPSDPNETVKDISYQDKILFPQEELKELVDFLNENFKIHSDSLKKNVLKQGSLFFIKLGEDKKKLLDKDYSELVNGIQYSMNTLKRLQKVYINNYDIGKIPLQLEEGTIKKDSEEFERISPEYKEFDVKFAIGFNTIKFGNDKSYEQIKLLKEKPNFYKYFPMGDEVNGFGFIVHCDSFSNEANRRKLHEDDVNSNLFPELAKFITQRLDEYKNTDRNKFLNLYASFLLSDIPERQNNKWLKPVFYDKLLNSLQKNIPTKTGFSDNAQNVKINKLKLQLNLSDFGLSHIQWFEWNNEADQLLIDEATKSEKLAIKEWDIRDLVENANLESINHWIATCDKKNYDAFLKELDESYLRKETKERICQINLFKFSNGDYYSFNEIISLKDRLGKTTFKFNNCFFKNNKVKGIKSELIKLGLVVSEVSVEEYPSIFGAVTLPENKRYYDLIAEKCKTNTLIPQEKKKLFLNFTNETTKFDNVAEGTLKDLFLFCDSNSQIKPLNKLIGNTKTPSWLNPYKIKKDEYFAELNPFLISESEEIFKEIFQKSQDDILAELTTVEEIKSLIKLYQDNQKYFFKEFIIKKDNNNFLISEKKSDTYQVQSADKETRNFIDENCADNLFVLPYEFLDYKDEDGIIKVDDLHSLIIDFVDADEHKEILVDIVKHKAKYKFLQDLSEFKFNSGTEYTKEDYEYKILDLACNVLKESDYQKFKSKVIIETENQDLKLSEIPPFADKIKIEDYEISLAKILPDTYQNSDHLTSLINQFVNNGINKERIENLLGIKQEVELKEIFNLFSEQTDGLKNAEQLVFILVYGKVFEENIENFKVETLDEKEWELKYNYYINPFTFIDDDYLLKNQYSDISKIFNLPITIGTSENQILLQPYFTENKLVCPNIKTNLSDKEKLDFLNFIFNEWKKDKMLFTKEIDWSKINGTDTNTLLGFNPNYSVFPNQYASEKEQLPEYFINWIGSDNSKISFLSDLGFWTEMSVLVDLRKFLKGEVQEFQNSRIPQEIRFNDDETMLFNTFEWLKENEIELSTEDQFDAFKKVIEIINENRTKDDLVIQDKDEDKYDFELLKGNSTVWKETENYSIFLYESKMPIIVKLDEIDDYVFYRYSDDDFVVNEDRIYINENYDKKKTLQKVASDENNDFSFEELWSLFGESLTREQELEKEIAKLKQQVAKKDSATLGAEDDTDISKNDQIEANREAKEIVKEKLEEEGFEFKRGIDKYSTINGVFKDGIEYPLVVKSYTYQEEPLKIGANEWIQLMKPNSMFWMHFGNRELGCLKLYELLRNQDKVTISFSTENLDKDDRLEKFAELLHYFGNVHFNFNNIKPSDYKVSNYLSDYRFDERKTENDLSADDENLL